MKSAPRRQLKVTLPKNGTSKKNSLDGVTSVPPGQTVHNAGGSDPSHMQYAAKSRNCRYRSTAPHALRSPSARAASTLEHVSDPCRKMGRTVSPPLMAVPFPHMAGHGGRAVGVRGGRVGGARGGRLVTCRLRGE
jgi:hypothetical protein